PLRAHAGHSGTPDDHRQSEHEYDSSHPFSFLRRLVLLWSSDREREPGTHSRSPLCSGSHLTGAAQFLSPLTHRGESHATAHSRWQSLPIIAHLHLQRLLLQTETNRGMG